MQKKILLIFILLFSQLQTGELPRFSETALEIPLYHGLSGFCRNPSFADLDADGDLDVVFEQDNTPGAVEYPVLFRNQGSADQPFFQRDDTTFAFLGGIIDWNYWHNLRLQDYDHDGLIDITFIVKADLPDPYSRVLGFRNIGTVQSPEWDHLPDTLYRDTTRIQDYVVRDLIGDATPEISLIRWPDTGLPLLELYRQENDSLILQPDFYFLLITQPLPFTRLDVVENSSGGEWYLILNSGWFQGIMTYNRFQHHIFKNVGTHNQPYWQLVSYGPPYGVTEASTEIRPLLSESDSPVVPLYYQFKSYTDELAMGLFFPEVDLDSAIAPSGEAEIWMGKQVDVDLFDWQDDGTPDILLTGGALYEYDHDFGVAGIVIKQCLPDFLWDPHRPDYPFARCFPKHLRDFEPPGYYRSSLADLDADGNIDLLESIFPPWFDGYFRIAWNTGNDAVPVWNQFQSLYQIYPNDIEATHSLTDLDKDGDLDLIFSDGQMIRYYSNNGTPQLPLFDSVGTALCSLSAAHFAFADLDEDGDQDIVVNSFNPTGIHYFRNDSQDTLLVFSEIDSVFAIGLPYGPLAFVDGDRDGDQDLLLVEATTGELFYLENQTLVGIEVISTVARKFRLSQNYPNPFNSGTTIEFDLPKASEIKVTIYNLLGQKVRTLWNGRHSAGQHQLHWDGRDEMGQEVASGVYICRLSADRRHQYNKLVLIR